VGYHPLRALDDLLAAPAASSLPAPLLGSGGGGRVLAAASAAAGGFGLGELGLPSVTSPCYFAVATDAIALGRLFESQDRQRRRRRGGKEEEE
jgi:hypothetical protein